jgi:four helix bundle protein
MDMAGETMEDRRQKPEARRQKTEDRRQKTEDRRQKTEDRRQKTEARRGKREEGRGKRGVTPYSEEGEMMERAKRFQDLVVWQKAHELVLATYRVTGSFPKHELYGLTSQVRRSVVSVPANIAEGFRKRGRADKARFLNIAEGSLEETRYYFILATELQYADCSDLIAQIEEVSRMLDTYRRRVEES